MNQILPFLTSIYWSETFVGGTSVSRDWV